MIKRISPPKKERTSSRKKLRRLVEFQGIRKLSLRQYRDHVRQFYDGPAGAMLSLASLFSLHEPLVGNILKLRKYDVTEARHILDIGSGAGQIMGHLLKLTRPNAKLVAFDLSQQMLRRQRTRLKSHRPAYIAGDLLRLPFAENSFDCVTCGWVIEYLPDPHPGLQEIGRVLKPGGSALILTTEDTVSGVFCSRTWRCRTHNRREFQRACEKTGLNWKEQHWFSSVHRFFRMGGIIIEAVKSFESNAAPQMEAVEAAVAR